MRLIIFGKSTAVITKKSDHDSVEFHNGQIVVNNYQMPEGSLLREFLAELLYSQLLKIYDGIKKENMFELFGNLDFEIMDKIDRKKQRVAKLKGNKILVALRAVALPKSALKYVVVHELAHIQAKRHSRKFWKIVETIYPSYKKGEQSLLKHDDSCEVPSLFKRIQ